MHQPIPNFDHNLVLPPHLGDPTEPSELSPYPCTSLEVCERFATSPERIAILRGFLAFREQLNNLGLTNGYQWLGGSFLEDVETREGRPPRDLDIVTVYWGYDYAFQQNLVVNLPAFKSSGLSKIHFSLDHYPLDASMSPFVTIDYTRYWIQLFSHNRDAVWKGMLKVSLNTPDDDKLAMDYLNTK